MVKQLIFLGAPGVGKGTVAALLAERKGLEHISTGAIFRNEIASGSKLGQDVEKILAAGAYVPDEITNTIVEKALNSESVKARGFILDGYPRTLFQARFLLEKKVRIDNVILLTASPEVTLKRLLGRGRQDDNEVTIRERLKIYESITWPLVDFYQGLRLLTKVTSEGSIESAYEAVVAQVYHG